MDKKTLMIALVAGVVAIVAYKKVAPLKNLVDGVIA